MQARIAVDVTPETMNGNTPMEKAMNAFLTKSFIGSSDIPADECLTEARDVIGWYRAGSNTSPMRFKQFLAMYFSYQFFNGSEKQKFAQIAIEAYDILVKHWPTANS